MLGDLISDLYEICTDDDYIGQVMNDIFNAHYPTGGEITRRYAGDKVTVVVTQ